MAEKITKEGIEVHNFDIIVIGAGSGGLNIASFMNKAGFKTLLIDKAEETIGGDCLNFGCVPSKALIHISKIIKESAGVREFGLICTGVTDLKKVMDYVRSKQNIIREHENSSYFQKLGIYIELGEAKFVSKNQIAVNGKVCKSKKIVIATGSRPRKLNIPGIENVKYLTNENIFSLEKLPKRLVVIGGGPIGIELGQAFLNMGSIVTVIQNGPVFLPKERPEVSQPLLDKLRADGMVINFNSVTKEFSKSDELLFTNEKGVDERVQFDNVLVSIGRDLNVEGLDSEKAGIKTNEEGTNFIVDKYLRTTNKNVLVCGDIAGSYKFTHTAELHAGVILNNFFSPLKKKINYDNLSWVTYTNPEIATFGISEDELDKREIKHEKLEFDFTEDDRSIVTDYTEGRLVLFIRKNKILGGSMVGVNAGEIFQELVLANTAKLDIKEIFNKIYPYPTASRVNKRIITQHFSGKLTENNKKILKMLY